MTSLINSKTLTKIILDNNYISKKGPLNIISKFIEKNTNI